MQKITKGIVSLVLAFVLCFSSCPLTVIEGTDFMFFKAEAADEQRNITESQRIKLKNTAALDTPTVYFTSAESVAEYTGSYGEQLFGNSKGIYDALVKQYAVNREYEAYDITLDEPISFALEVKGNKFVQNDAYIAAVQALTVDFQNAIDAFFYDCADVFWLKGGQYEYFVEAEGSAEEGYTGVIEAVTYLPSAYHTKEISDYDTAVKNAVKEIKSKITDTSDRYEAVKAIHDYVCDNAYYKLSVLEYTVHNSYPFFLGDGGMVCDGYARTFKVLCDAFGIECACIGGYAYNSDGGEAHMWNYVKMDDERWYLVDTTWDDGSKKTDYTYFLANANSQGFYAPLSEERYEINTFSEAGYTKFVYPLLSEKAFKRHYHSWDSDYTTDKKATCTAEGVKSIHCSGCDTVKNKEEIPAKGHKFVLTETLKATYKEKGTETYTCSRCGKEKINTLDYKKLGKAKVLKTVSVTDKSVKLAWSSVKGAEKYILAYKQSGGEWKKVTVSKCSIKLTKLKAGAKYYFRVRAVAGENKGDYCSSLTQRTNPAKVGNITFEQNTTSIKLSWPTVSGATGYRVYKYNPKSKKWEKLYTTTKTKYKVKNLSVGTSYKFRVKAYIKDGGQTLWGEASDTYKTATKPAKTEIRSLTAKTATFVAKWKKVEGVSGYLLEYSTKKDFSDKTKVLVKGGDSLKKTVKGLKSGKTYYVRVRTYKTSGGVRIYSAASNIKKVTVK